MLDRASETTPRSDEANCPSTRRTCTFGAHAQSASEHKITRKMGEKRPIRIDSSTRAACFFRRQNSQRPSHAIELQMRSDRSSSSSISDLAVIDSILRSSRRSISRALAAMSSCAQRPRDKLVGDEIRRRCATRMKRCASRDIVNDAWRFSRIVNRRVVSSPTPFREPRAITDVDASSPRSRVRRARRAIVAATSPQSGQRWSRAAHPVRSVAHLLR